MSRMKMIKNANALMPQSPRWETLRGQKKSYDMKSSILVLALGTIFLISCNNSKSFIIGSWVMDNLNSSDTSINRETLFATSLVSHYTDKNILIFMSDNSVSISTADGKELDKGNFKLLESGTYLSVKFSNDKMESKYQITDKTDKALKLTATDDGETVNILLSRMQQVTSH